jgi:hypothetical protein
MTATTMKQLVLNLPQDVVDLIQHTAKERRQTFDQVVTEELRFALQPVHEEAMRRLKRHIRQQQSQPEEEIRRHLNAHLSETDQTRLAELLERSHEEGLTKEEQAELQTLFDQIEAAATEKAAAIWLLSGRSLDADDRP